MYQKEIIFFWPLTEQIPLDLDYSECDLRSQLFTTFTTSLAVSNGSISSDVSWEPVMRIPSNTTIIVDKKPGVFRKFIYKLIGFKWEVN